MKPRTPHILASMALAILAALVAPHHAWAQDEDEDEDANADEAGESSEAGETGTAEPAREPSLFGRKIERIQFRGNRKVEDDAIRVNLSSKAGSVLDRARVRSDMRAMWRMGFFDDITLEADTTAQGSVVLTFAVKEKPSVRKVLISGNNEIEIDKINEVLDLKRDAILDLSAVKRNEGKIHDLYVEKGYYLGTVSYDIRPANESEVDIWYLINENSKVEIRDVSFIGNYTIPDSELRNLISTRKSGALSFLSDSGIYQEENFERDILIISAYYWDHGHLNVKLGTPQIRLSRDKRYMYLSIPIDEGPVFSIGNIEFKGDLIGDKSEYYKRLSVNKGEIFNRSKVGHDITELTNYYKDRGYAYVNVTPLTNVDIDKRIVDLSFEIVQGKKVYFERINVRGNGKTRDKVLRREMKISEGELYSQTALDVSRRRIEALGYFERVDISTKRGSSDEFIEVNIEVAERPTGTFQIGAGFSSVENFIAQAQISQENLFGRGQSLTLQAQVSSLRQLFLLRFAEPYFLDSRWTFAFDLYNQVRAFTGFSREARGGNLTWGYPIKWPEARAFLTYTLETVGINKGTGTLFSSGAVQEQISSDIRNLFRGGVTSSVRGQVTWDSRNNRLFPTNGWNLSGFLEVADKVTGSENVFVRYGGFARNYRPLWGPFILKLNGEVGVTVSRDPLGVPIAERYLIGGIFDIRGFRPRTLGPRIKVQRSQDPSDPLTDIPLGGNLQIITNTEIEFPLFKRVGISGVVFFDAGNAYNLERLYCTSSVGGQGISEKFNPCFDFPSSLINGIRSSVGFGFRWFSPIGPLRFEWGIPLDRQPGEEPLVFEFTIGNFF